MNGSQYSSHSQAAWHSLRQDLHAPLAPSWSLQVLAQKCGCFLQLASHDATLSLEIPLGQNTERQLTADAEDSAPPTSTALPAHGITRTRVIAAL
mmetsp:Transcript_66218/g.213454  ORF Transcript_66218/g.213454 Transcript_66218/m.213454 type:complete len:95 (-) Transcript_66218:29-313(-)